MQKKNVQNSKNAKEKHTGKERKGKERKVGSALCALQLGTFSPRLLLGTFLCYDPLWSEPPCQGAKS
ncbi:hypothetical protein POVCU1_050750 [Plasmodium ovale curtisi]|uniref:Uncharacterized protein n=1 Tax=Plasmodium ovale curtisi TaxID=864141 RepID=A0A1A8X5Q8_PLAOA|nr:hypothetical protein POVCU1_050750 [Plasmodium ovale curtisi]